MTAFLILYVASLTSKMSLSFCGKNAPYKVTSCSFFSFIASSPDSDADGKVSFQCKSHTSSTSPGKLLLEASTCLLNCLFSFWIWN